MERLTLNSLMSHGHLATTFTATLPSIPSPLICKVMDIHSFNDWDERSYTPAEAVAALRHEKEVYDALGAVQGKLVPRCHGMFAGEEEGVMMILLEDAGVELPELEVGVVGGRDRAESDWRKVPISTR